MSITIEERDNVLMIREEIRRHPLIYVYRSNRFSYYYRESGHALIQTRTAYLMRFNGVKVSEPGKHVKTHPKEEARP